MEAVASRDDDAARPIGEVMLRGAIGEVIYAAPTLWLCASRLIVEVDPWS